MTTKKPADRIAGFFSSRRLRLRTVAREVHEVHEVRAVRIVALTRRKRAASVLTRPMCALHCAQCSRTPAQAGRADPSAPSSRPRRFCIAPAGTVAMQSIMVRRQRRAGAACGCKRVDIRRRARQSLAQSRRAARARAAIACVITRSAQKKPAIFLCACCVVLSFSCTLRD